MFKQKTVAEITPLELEIERLHAFMGGLNITDDQYSKAVDQFIKLQTLIDAQRPEKLSIDAKATIFANLAGIMLILNHERAGIVTSKALSFISKLR